MTRHPGTPPGDERPGDPDPVGDSGADGVAAPAPAAATDHDLASESVVATAARLRVSADSPLMAVVDVFAASDQAQLKAYAITSEFFLDEVIAHLNLVNPHPDQPYEYATLAETVNRFTDADTHASTEAATAQAPAPTEAAATQAPAAEAAAARTTAVEAAAPTADETVRATDTTSPATVEPADTDGTVVAAKSAEPNFPRFRLNRTPYSWVHDLAQNDDIAEYMALLGTTTSKTFSYIVTAFTLSQALPKFRRRCANGEFTIAHAEAAACLCRNVHFAYLPTIDEYLSTRRADITIETFRKSLQTKITVLQPVEDRVVDAHRRRRVDITTQPDGTAYVTLTGPALELQAMYQRIHAIAKAIRTGNTKAFDAHLPDGVAIDEHRTIMALMFDIITRSDPQLTLEVIATDTSTGLSSSTTVELDTQGVRTQDDLVDVLNQAASDTIASDTIASGAIASGTIASDAIESAADADPAGADATGTVACPSSPDADDPSAEADGSPGDRLPDGRRRVTVDPVSVFDLPDWSARKPNDPPGARYKFQLGCNLTTLSEWFAAQGRLVTTVPFLSLIGLSDLPGSFPDGSPVPAEVVRQLAAHVKSWSRILTDPAEGTPLDARARMYQVPPEVRRTLVAAWQWCSVPGCTNPATTAEIDHIEPFNHDDPEAGGPTTFLNTHPLCKPHHQAKTDNKYQVRRSAPGELEYDFRHGITITASPPDNQVDVEQARLFTELLSKPPPSRTEPAGPGLDDGDPADWCARVEAPTVPPPPEPVGPPEERMGDDAVRKSGDVRFSTKRPVPKSASESPWSTCGSWSEVQYPSTESFWDSDEPPPF